MTTEWNKYVEDIFLFVFYDNCVLILTTKMVFIRR